MKKLFAHCTRGALIMSALILFFTPNIHAGEVGKITYVDGRVDVTRTNSQMAMPLREEETVFAGDIIRTKSNSKAEITFKDKSVLRLAQESRVKISDYQLDKKDQRKTATVELYRGKIQTIIAKMKKEADFNIDTPNAHGTITGSEVFAFFQAGNSGMLVSSGSLSVINPELPVAVPPIIVTPGNSVLIHQQEAPLGPRPYLEIEKKFHEQDTSPPAFVTRKDLNVIQGLVVKISGDVKITPKGKKSAHQIELSEVIKAGDTIQTGDNGKIEIKFENGNAMNLKSNTKITITKLDIDPKTEEFEQQFEMSMGKLRARVENIKSGSSFRVKTPTAIAGVRGTIMYLEVSPAKTDAFFEGGKGFLTSQKSGKTVDVGMGENSSADNKGNVSDSSKTTQEQRMGITEGWEPGSGIEGYSSPEGSTNDYLYDEGTNITDEGQTDGITDGTDTADSTDEGGGISDSGGGTSSSDFVDVPVTETGTDTTDVTEPEPTPTPTPEPEPEPEPEPGNYTVSGAFSAGFGYVDPEEGAVLGLGSMDGQAQVENEFGIEDPEPILLAGTFSYPESSEIGYGLWGLESPFAATSNVDGTGYLSIMGGTNIDNVLDGVLYGFYIRPDGDGGFFAGLVSSNDITGAFNTTEGTFEAAGMIEAYIDTPTSITPQELYEGSPALAVDSIEEMAIGGDIQGVADGESINLEDQNWGMFRMSSLGTFTTLPDNSWNADIGSAASDGGYTIGHIVGDTWSGNKLSGSVEGSSINVAEDFMMTNFSGDLLGVYGAESWQALSAGTFTFEPLAFGGDFDYFDEFEVGSVAFSGAVGGVDSLWSGSPQITMIGAFDNAAGFSHWTLIDPVEGQTIDGGTLLGELRRIKAFDHLRVLLDGFYIRPDASSPTDYRAGYVKSLDLEGDMYPEIGMFDIDGTIQAFLDLPTVHDPADLYDGSPIIEGYDYPEEMTMINSANFSGQLGTSSLNIDDQNWGLISFRGPGGSYESLPGDGWTAKAYGSSRDDFNEITVGYWMGDIFGDAWQNNEFSGSGSGRTLNYNPFDPVFEENEIGTFDVDLLGTYYEGTWRAFGAGVYEEAPLQYGGILDGDFGFYAERTGEPDWGYGSMSAVFGGAESPWTVPVLNSGFRSDLGSDLGSEAILGSGSALGSGSGASFLPITMMGEYDNPDNYALWSTIPYFEGSTQDNAKLLGTTDGVMWGSQGNVLKGLLGAFYIREAGVEDYRAGYLYSSDLTGAFYSDIGMFDADGALTVHFDNPTSYIPNDLQSGNPAFVEDANNFVGTIDGGVFDGEITIASDKIEDQNWGGWQGVSVGSFESLPGNGWEADISGSPTGEGEPTGYLIGTLSGDAWQNDGFSATVSGSFLNGSVTGTIWGDMYGTYYDADNSWQALSAGMYMEEQVLAFGGDFGGVFGTYNTALDDLTTSGGFSGSLGGTDPLFPGTPQVSFMGEFANPDSHPFLWTDFNIEVEATDGGRILGALFGLKINDILIGKFLGIAINENDGQNETGYVASPLFTGNFYPATGMFDADSTLTAPLNYVTTHTPAELVSGSAAVDEYDPIILPVAGDIAGEINLHSVVLEDQSWDLQRFNGGGTYATTPSNDWHSVIGFSDHADGEDSYLIWHLNGNQWTEGYLEGTVTGRFMSLLPPTQEAFLRGDIIEDGNGEVFGIYDQGQWQAVGSTIGWPEETDLQFGSPVSGSFGRVNFNFSEDGGIEKSGSFSAILGGTEALFTGSPQITVMGEFNNPADRSIWVNDEFIEGRTSNGAAFFGVLGGTNVDNVLTGGLDAFYIRPDGNGGYRTGKMSSGRIDGNFYPGIGMFEATGTVTTSFDLPTAFSPADLYEDGPALEPGADLLGIVNHSDFTGEFNFSSANIVDQGWGLMWGVSGGTYENLPGTGWTADVIGMTNPDAIDSNGVSVMGQMTGPVWSNSRIESDIDGIWIALDREATGVTMSGGTFSAQGAGTYVEVNEGATWEAANTGEWVEVTEILDLTGIADDVVALGTLDVPVTEVYTSLLAGTGAFDAGGALSITSMQMDFYTMSSAADNGIWAAIIDGSYSTPTGNAWTAAVTGNLIDNSTGGNIGTVNAVLDGTLWGQSGNWEADVSGATTTGVALGGAASGTYVDGTLDGAATGIWGQQQ